MKFNRGILLISVFGAFAFVVEATEFDPKFTQVSCVNGQLSLCFRETHLDIPGVNFPSVPYTLTALAIVDKTCFNPAKNTANGFNSSSQTSINITQRFRSPLINEASGCFNINNCPPPPEGDCPPPLRSSAICRYVNMVLANTIKGTSLQFGDKICTYNLFCFKIGLPV